MTQRLKAGRKFALLGWLAVIFLALLSWLQPAQAHRHHHMRHSRRLYRPVSYAPVSHEGPTALGISSIVMDATTGAILSQNDAYSRRYPASLTKLMTLDLAFQALRDHRISLATAIPVTAEAAMVQPVKLNLQAGQSISVEQAILGMTTYSANDAATALGQYLGGGSIGRFAQMMTLHATALGMSRTAFYNPSGLPNPGQMTDAYDMAVLTRHILMTYPEFRYVFGVRSFQFEGRTIPNIDGMLRLYPGAIGMKTGFTNLARFNVVTAAVRNGHLLIGVELHASSWSEGYHVMAQLLDRGFADEGGSGPIIALRKALPALVSVAEARDAVQERPIIRQASIRRIIKPPVIRLATARHLKPHEDAAPAGGWIAQVGAYRSYREAKHQAVIIRDMRTIGVPRVASTRHRGHRLYRAELAGLDRNGARHTCHLLARHHRACIVIPPREDQLAMR